MFDEMRPWEFQAKNCLPSSSFYHEDAFTQFPFDFGSPFDLIFPLSSIDRFKHVPLRRLSNGDISASGSIIRNIPIKLEKNFQTKAGELNSDEDYKPITRHNYREYSVPLPTTNRVFSSVGRDSSPPLPPQRKYIGGVNTTSSYGTNEQKKNRNQTITSSTPFLRFSTNERPSVAPKPKFIKESNTCKPSCVEYDRPRTDASQIDRITWRTKNIGDSFGDDLQYKIPQREGISPMNLNLSVSFDNDYERSTDSPCDSLISNVEQYNSAPSETEIKNLTFQPEDTSSSPSSSGIVADLNASKGENFQSQSATSSITTCSSSCSHSEVSADIPQAIIESQQDDISRDNCCSEADLIHSLASSNANVLLQSGKEREDYPVRESLPRPLDSANTSALHNVFNEIIERDAKPMENPAFRIHPLSTDLRAVRNRNSRSDSSENNSQNDVLTRKRVICTKLSENFRLINNAVLMLNERTAAQAWRQPHILQKNLFEIKDSVGIIANAVVSFVDSIYRIAINFSNPKYSELQQLFTPIQNSNKLIMQLKQNLDDTGWTLAALSRPRIARGTVKGNDALDQFIAVVRQLPSDCCKMVQWVLVLIPSSTIQFLPPYSSLKQIPEEEQSNMGKPDEIYENSTGLICENEELRRPSVASFSKPLKNSTYPIENQSSVIPAKQFFSVHIQASNKSLPESNSSMKENKMQTETAKTNNQFLIDLAEDHVMEEDDLESVLGDRETLSQDYAFIGDEISPLSLRRYTTNSFQNRHSKIDAFKTLCVEDKQLMQFYSSQVDDHAEFLSKAIEEFLNVVEAQQTPREFVQKGKLIILAAHKLIYIGDSIAQCVNTPLLRNEMKKSADRLCNVLKSCVQATKHAADEYPLVSAVQSMVDWIVTVSYAAHDLKLLIKQCC